MALLSQTEPIPMGKNATYIKLLSAQVVSLVGTGISTLTLALLAWDIAGDEASAVLGIAFALKMIAYVGLAPVFGAIAHKLPRKPAMITLDLVRAGFIMFLPFVTETWQIYVLVFCINACSAGFTPLYQSTLPAVLPDENQYLRALSFSRLAYDLEQIISPLLTASLLVVLGFRQLFILNAFTFLLSAILLMICVFPLIKAPPHCENGPLNQLKYGLQSYLSTPRLRTLWIGYLAASAASAMVIVNTVVYVNQVLIGGEQETALAMAVVGFGSMVVALKLPKWLEGRKLRGFMLLGSSMIVCAFLIAAQLPGWYGFIWVCLLFGAGMSFIQTPAGVLIIRSCQEEDATAFFAAHFSLTHLWWLFTYLLAGWSAVMLGLSAAYWVMGVLCLCSLLAVYRWFPKED
ncbi:MFS transporter [Photobacterium rosenbergii]|uniref:MFS transporter n=1 Tax=Photobacterium rosenbergii TaxID=294936 RepID=UPI0021BDD340|nr:MFS transporter [Photobacterium rosenbergii]